MSGLFCALLYKVELGRDSVSLVPVLQTDLCESERGFSLSPPLLVQFLLLLLRSEGQLLLTRQLNIEVAGLDGLEGENVTRKKMSGGKG